MSQIEDRIKHRLREIDEAGLTRRLFPPAGVDLSSNDYLCLATDERLKNAAHDAIERYGVGSTGSRLLRGERESFDEAEKVFADWKGTERSLYFATGYQANLAVLSTFLEPGDAIFSDELNHASIIDGIRLSRAEKFIFPHRDVSALEKLLRITKVRGRKFLVTESVFSMDGTIAPLDKYAALCRETGTAFIVDEAHAVGVFGAKGSGLLNGDEDMLVSVNTAGKALGAAGAFVAGSARAIEYLLQKARPFIFSTAPLPLTGDVIKTAIEIVKSEPSRREKLLDLSAFLRALLNENGIAVSGENSQIVPVMIGESERAVAVANELQAAGFDVRAIRPPTVAPGTARLRVSLNSGLTEEILREFVEHLVKVI